MSKRGAGLLCLAWLWGCHACDRAPEPERSTASAPAAAEPADAFLSAGGLGVCASDGARPLRCWGNAERGLDVAGARSVALGDHDACVVSRGRDVACRDAQPGLAGAARAVALGEDHACALLTGGTVWCWGDNRRGQLGDGTTEPRERAVRVADLDGVRAIAAGAAHTCALREDGTVSCWGGYPTSDDVGAAPTTPEELLAAAARLPAPRTRATPVAGIEHAVAVAAGGSQSCAVGRDQLVRCWPGYLGAHAEPSALPWPTDATDVAMAGPRGCVLRAAGGVACFGPSAVVPTAIRSIGDARAVACGGDRCCARRRDASVVCWDDDGAQVALGSEGETR